MHPRAAPHSVELLRAAAHIELARLKTFVASNCLFGWSPLGQQSEINLKSHHDEMEFYSK